MVSNLSLFSGGAVGSDCEWERIGRKYGLQSVTHFYHGRPTPRGNVLITDLQLEDGMRYIREANVYY